MEFNEKTQPMTTTTALLDTADERPVDVDVVLPDYCPDVAAILCCELIPSVTASGWNGDKLTADGTALLRVLYLDEGRKTVYTYEITQAFSAAFLTDGRQNDTAAEVTATTDYVHCRAVSPRRLDIHGAIHVKASAATATAQTVLSDVAEENVYLKTETVTASVPAGAAQKPFSIGETIASADGIERVLRSCAVPTVSEIKVLAGKIIAKGNLHIHVFALCDAESGKTTGNEYTLPFSQMLDLPGVDEDATVDVTVRTVSHNVRIEEESGEKSLYSATKLALCAQAWTNENATVVTDVYATTMPVTVQTQAVDCRRLLSVSTEPMTVTKTMELPTDAAHILSAWCEATALSAENGEMTRTLGGRLSVHLLYADGEGQVQYAERTADFSERFAAVGTAEQSDFSVTSCDAFSEQEGQLTVKATLDVTRRQFEMTHVMAVTGVAGEETAAYPNEEAAVKIVYADAGESLWDVAKAGHTSVAALKAENELDGDVLPKRTMLLVPLL